MMTPEQYRLLLTPEVRHTVEEQIGRDPAAIALDKRIPHAALVATQVKYLARARTKLPSYYEARCILPPLAFEQASSEACAARKSCSGNTVLDLTCGLGVDALYLSKRFREVITLERDATLAAVAEENFRRLGATNIRVINSSAEAFLASTLDHFDWIYADPDRLRQVFINIMDNAIKYSGDSPHIQITAEERNGSVIIRITDNGIGIEEEHLAHIFDKFYRVSNSKRPPVRGYGIGLFYVKTMIHMHNGTIRVESQPGKGSCFIITLPQTHERQEIDIIG